MNSQVEQVEPDMSWIDIAVGKCGNTVVDYADGWRGYIDETFVEDCIDTDVQFPSERGLYRWSGFDVGAWEEGDLIVLRSGGFRRYSLASLASQPPVLDEREVIERAAVVADQYATMARTNAKAAAGMSFSTSGWRRIEAICEEIAAAIRNLGGPDDVA